MPKPVKKSKTEKGKEKTRRLALRELSAELERVRSKLHETLIMVDSLWQALYTTGLDERGPITERDDDIPF